MRVEVDSLMAPLNIPIEWRTLNRTDLDNPSVQLAVVTFKGACNSAEYAYFKRGTGPLAWTHISDGVVLPFADVDCNRVHELIDRSLTPNGLGRRDALFGRALGRVLTHELFHIFTGSTHHGKDDVAQPVYTSRELMADSFHFGDKELGTLRQSFIPVLRSLRRSKGLPLKSAAAGLALFRSGSCGNCHGSDATGKGSAPALRAVGKEIDAKQFAARWTKEMTRMFHDSKLATPVLNGDDIDDIVSYLNSLEQNN